jgi:hypothetical protein
MAGGDLDVAQTDTGVEHGGHERVTEYVGVHARHPDPGGGGQVFEPSGRGVAVHADAEPVPQNRAVFAVADRAVDGSADRWRQWDQDDLAAFAAHPQNAMAVHLTKVSDAGAAGFEDLETSK